MSLVINSNTLATVTRNYLDTNQENLKTSLARLASGSRIVKSSDDAGGLAVGNKLGATVRRNERAQQNVQNSISFLQVQDGGLTQVGKILDRMSELKTMSLDVTKNSLDIDNYNAEFNQLQNQLGNIRDEQFNGINLFTTSHADLSAYTTAVGDGDTTGDTKVQQVDTVTIAAGTAAGAGEVYTVALNNETFSFTSTAAAEDQDAIAAALITAINAGTTGVTALAGGSANEIDLTADTAGVGFTPTVYTSSGAGTTISSAATAAVNVENSVKVSLSRETIFKAGVAGDGLVTSGSLDLTVVAAGSNSLTNYTVDDFTTFIQNAATARAVNGSEMSRLEASYSMLTTNHGNIEAARSRLLDVDIATESTKYAKHNILVQSSAAMLAQANSVPNIALQLIG